MKYLVVIPARGGSKGIPLKNIYLINGKPMLEYTIEAAIDANICGNIVVSTDSDQIAEVASKYNDVKIIKRPASISTDQASTEDVLLHAIDYMFREYNEVYDCVITLQPTSPLRKPETIKSFISSFEQMDEIYDAQLTLTESRSDYWTKDVNQNFGRLFPNAPRRRQERDPLYIENSAIYLTKMDTLKSTHSVLGTKVNGFVISEIEGVDINEYQDIHLVEFHLNQLSKLS